MNRFGLATATLVFSAIALVAVVRSAPAASSKVETWKGYVTDTWCGVDRDRKPPTAECTRDCVQAGRGRYAFYNFEDGKVYVLNPQDQAAKYAGQRVTLSGTVDDTTVHMKTQRGDREGKTITAAAISPATP